MPNQFTWVPIYHELANKLIEWQDRQTDLISFLEDLRTQQYTITPLMDKGADGARFLISEIDPFTFFGVFNRGVRQDQRLAILFEMKEFFHLNSALPEEFDGIPILNNMKSWFVSYQETRDIKDIGYLWNVFRSALDKENPLNNKEFLNAFDDALTVKSTNINLTMGLFWIRPETFINMDNKNRAYLKIKLPGSGLSAKFYADTVRTIKQLNIPFTELSLAAWFALEKNEGKPEVPEKLENIEHEDVNYWMVGANWDSKDPSDQTERFQNEGIWENGYLDRYIDEVNSMQVGDKIAIKSTYTQRKNLPFNGRGKTISRMDIKTIGTIIANRNDGKTIEVEWEQNFKEKHWYFYTFRKTVWHLRNDKEYAWKKIVDQLIDFAWYGKGQDYDFFCKLWWDEGFNLEAESKGKPEDVPTPYSIEDIVASGVFLSEIDLSQFIELLRSKKAVILQGAPGVGKTFIARKLAYALMNEIDNNRLEMIQFHQSYSYDDFIRGYRPLPGKAGSFGLQNGIFYDFCQKAIKDPDREYVFIIDEINRGNLSQIFGELLMLIEADKRGPEFALPLVYRNEDEPRFYLPPNLYLMGLMNLADRSLAMVDYALRRRFAFISLQPQYESDLFKQWLLERSMDSGLVQFVIERMTELNRVIREDQLLGENYQIGHSFFCPKGDNFSGLDMKWYRGIVNSEISPLMKEYWFDNQKKAEEAIRMLNS
jgi:5-methylcytosine-specific restriction protein B